MKKSILITGSTDGIGKLTAMKLAKDGHTVYVHGRNQEKVKNTVSEIIEKSLNDNISGFVADFSDLDSVRAMATHVKSELSLLDVLINNAGVYGSPVSENKDGLDMRFVVNYLAPYVLSTALIPLMNESADARIVNLSSAAQSSVSLEALKGSLQLTQSEAYAQSKLALTMWSFYLAKELREFTVIAVNPGSLLNTKMVKEAFGNHWASADKGADILCDLAVSERYQGLSGKYFDNDRGNFGNAHPDAYDEDGIARLMEATKRIIN